MGSDQDDDVFWGEEYQSESGVVTGRPVFMSTWVARLM